MPYVIETYKGYRNAKVLSLVDVDKDHPFDTLEEANRAIGQRLLEQEQDNALLMEAYDARLLAHLFDQDTDDRIPVEPTLYHYVFQPRFYTAEELANLP